MTNVSDYPITVDGVRLDTLAKGVEASSLTLGGLRSADTLLAGLDGVVASVDDSREPSTLGLSMFVRGTDDDGLVPVGKDGQAVYQENLQALKHLLAKSGTLLDVRRTIDKNTMLARTNLLTNPSFRGTTGTVEVKRNLMPNPAARTAGASVEARRNYVADPRLVNGSGWNGVTATGVAGAATVNLGGGVQVYSPNQAAAVGDTWSGSLEITAPAGAAVAGNIGIGGTTGGSFAGNGRGVTNFNIPAGTTQRISNAFTLGATADGLRLLVTFTTTIVAGTKIDKAMIEKVGLPDLPYMDGATAAAGGLTYSWVGAVNASQSIATGVAVASGVGTGAYQANIGGKKWFATAYGPFLYVASTGVAGKYYAASVLIAGNVGAGYSLASTDNLTGSWLGVVNGVIPAGGQVRVYLPSGPPCGNSAAGALMFGLTGSPGKDALRMTEIVVEEVPGPGVALSPETTAYDGSTPPSDGLTYSWTGTVDASPSIATGAQVTGWTPGVFATTGTTAAGRVIKQGVVYSGVAGGVAVGQFVGARIVLWATQPGLTARLAIHDGTGYAADLGYVNLPVVPTEFAIPATAPLANTQPRIYVYPTPFGASEIRFKPGATLEVVSGIGQAPASTLDGTTPGAGWNGTPDASTSTLDSSDLQAYAKVQDAITPEDHPGDVGRLAAVLMVPGVYWRSLLALAWSQPAVNAGTAYEVTSLQGSSAPVDDAVVCLTGPANTGAQIIDDATGSFVRLNEALPAGSTWRVNVGTWESRVGVGLTVDSADTAGTDKSGVTDQGGVYPRLLRLNPRLSAGARRVKVRTAGGGFTAATTLTIKARRAHL